MHDIGNYKEAAAKLREVWINVESHDVFRMVIESQEDVLEKFQPIFSLDHISQLHEEEFRAFLLFKNNRHWSGLQRHGPKMCADMNRLRSGLSFFFDEEKPIEDRMVKAIGQIDGMGKAVATAILHIAFPEKYGVWNGISEGALKTLNLWPRFERGASMGKQFVDINATLLRLIDELDTDLWTIDTLFWAMQEIPSDDENTYQHSANETSLPESERPDQRFGLERHLQEFLRDNWNATSLSNEWDMYSEEGNPDAGYEYPCGIGRIDLLAKHKEKPHWLVIELKKDQTSDETVGQILRYIGWVKEHLAELDEKVFGLIIAHQTDERLRYALNTVPHVQIQLYEVNFQLLPF